MGRPSVIPQVRERLEQYLDELQRRYVMQDPERRVATMPATTDGKVNVRAIANAIGLRETQEKYLYERPELSSLVNLLAEGQGLAPIGARTMQDAVDRAAKAKAQIQAQRLRTVALASVEAQAQRDELLQAIKELSQVNQRLAAENTRLRARLEAIERGIFMPEAP